MLGDGRLVSLISSYLAFNVNRLVGLHVGLKGADVSQDACHIVWVL